MSPFRNYATFNTDLLPVKVLNAIQPCMWKGEKVFTLLTSVSATELYLYSSPIERVPLLTIWDLYDDDDNQHGYMFQVPAQDISSSSSHILVQSKSLVRNFSVDDALAEGKVTRMASVPQFNVYHYDIGATLLAQKALGLMSKVLDRDAK